MPSNVSQNRQSSRPFIHTNIVYEVLAHRVVQFFTNPVVCFRVYQWIDDRGKKSRLSAPQYIDYIMTYVQKTINDEAIFPTKQESKKAQQN